MDDIIKNIEAAQLKQEITEFHVGDTVKVYEGKGRQPREDTGLRGRSVKEAERRRKGNFHRKEILKRCWR